jgi:hypothetical protein
VRTVDAASSNINTPNTPSDFLSRHYFLSENGVGGTYAYNLTLRYNAAGDVNGTEGSIRLSRYNGAGWTNYLSTVTSPNIAATALNQASFALNGAELSGRGGSTYLWNATTGTANWQTAASWTPARSVPVFDDVLIFSNGGSSIADNVPAQTIGQLIMSSNTAVTLIPTAANNTLTLVGGSGNDLSIPSGCTMTVGQASGNSLSLVYSGTGHAASIAGTYTIPVNTTNIHTYAATNSVTTVSGTLNNGGTVTSTALNLFFGADPTVPSTRRLLKLKPKLFLQFNSIQMYKKSPQNWFAGKQQTALKLAEKLDQFFVKRNKINFQRV